MERQAVSVSCICVSWSTSFARSPQWFHQVVYHHQLQTSNFPLLAHALMMQPWLQRACNICAAFFAFLNNMLTSLGYHWRLHP